MAETDQVHPLAPADYQLRSDYEDHEAMSMQSKLHRNITYIQYCGCLTVLLLVTIVMITVVFTFFHVKHPVIRMNSISIERQLENIHLNLTLLVDVSVKTPNYASFRYGNSTTVVYHGGMVMGKGQIPAGLVKARQMLQMKIIVDIGSEKIFSVQSWRSDNSLGTLNMSSYTRIDGTVKKFNIVKKYVVVRLNCSFTYNVWTRAIQDNCRQPMQL